MDYKISYLLYQCSHWIAQKFSDIQKDPTPGEESNPFHWTDIAV